jgi:hypothetical protein
MVTEFFVSQQGAFNTYKHISKKVGLIIALFFLFLRAVAEPRLDFGLAVHKDSKNLSS